MLRAYKYRLYPTPQQTVLINKHTGCCRMLYNLALETKSMAYTSYGKKLSCFDLMNQLPDLKKEYAWLKEVDSQALQQSIVNLDKAFTSFFKGTTEFPNLKKKSNRQSYRNPHGSKVSIDGNRVYIPKFKEGIKFVQDRPLKGSIRNCTISKTPTNKYFISILVETGKAAPKKKAVKENTAIGLDLGLTSYISDSNGGKYDNPKYMGESMARLKVFQRRLSRKVKGSNNRKKARLKVAIIHEKIANQRKDFLHKLSSSIISDNQTICMEDLNIKGMVKNHNLAGSISDAGWGMFVEMCKYKAEWRGKNFLQIPTFEPSTKICSNCGAMNHNLTLADREWICEKCLVKHDRDTNAAKNIKQYCIKQSGRVTAAEPVESSTLVGAMKQENIQL